MNDAEVRSLLNDLTRTKRDRNSASKRAILLADERDILKAENTRLRALLSWIEGACVDELPHSEIRAAIDRLNSLQGVALSNEGGDDGQVR
jgi:hypothetical protein